MQGLNVEDASKLVKARCRLMVKEPWYGHIAMLMEWLPSEMAWKDEESRTMGVRIVDGGRVQCLYYPKFIEKMTLEQLYGVVMHEIEHIVRLHPVRVGQREPHLYNVAADMCVNGRKGNPRIGYKEEGKKLVFPSEDAVFIPDDWPDDETAEYFYDKFPKQECCTCGQCQGEGGDSDGDGDGQSKSDQDGDDGDSQGGSSGQGGDQKKKQSGGGGKDKDKKDKFGSKLCPDCGKMKPNGQMIDDHDVWKESDTSEDEARQVVKDMTDQASAKAQGHVPGHLQEALKELAKPVVRWRELLRQLMGTYCGGRRLTFSRRNRRHDAFGLPGISHHACATVSLIVDTSGSISTKMLEQFFGEIEAISSKAKLFLLQWDHAFQSFDQYRRGDWKKLKVLGRGGTDMAAPVMWLVENRLQGDAIIMLTDGICNWAEPQPVPYICVIANTEQVDGPTWGHTVRTDLISYG